MEAQTPKINTDVTEFITNIKKWITIDTQIRQYNEKLKQCREMKGQIAPTIFNYMDQHNLENKQINTSEGGIVFFEKREYAPLTFGFIEETLNTIISNKEQVLFIMQHLKQNRKIKISKDIKRNVTCSERK